MRWLLGVLAALSTFAASGAARAEILDLRGPVRVGWGWSAMYRARVLSVSFEDEIALKRLSEGLDLQLVVGMDGQRGPSFSGPEGRTLHKGFLGVTAGPGLGWRLAPAGPLATTNVTFGPLWEAYSEDLVPHGLGVAGRVGLYPFYLDAHEILGCTHGWFREWVLSGLNGWALARYDWLGRDSGESWSVGFGVDLARHALFPILDAAVGPICPDKAKR